MSEFQRLVDLQNAAIKEYESVKLAFQAKMKAEFEPIFQEFFKAFPEIKMIAWTQYTPYFNDGDTCEFGVNDKVFVAVDAVKKYEEDEDEDEDEDTDRVSIYDLEYEYEFPYKKPHAFVYEYAAKTNDPYYTKQVDVYEQKKAELGPRFVEVCDGVEAMETYLSGIPEEIYLAAFGDHVEVRVTKDGIDVEEHEHD